MKLPKFFNKNSFSEENFFSPQKEVSFPQEKKENKNKLLVDVYEEGDKIIIRALVAGSKEEDIDIFLRKDIITISGRNNPPQKVKKDKYFCQECFWGEFSRSIVLPYSARQEDFQFKLKGGVLTIILKKLF